jgi:hypothetical protein
MVRSAVPVVPGWETDTQEKERMLVLTIYGLMGLAVMLVVAFYFAFEDEFSLARGNSSMDGTVGKGSETGPLGSALEVPGEGQKEYLLELGNIPRQPEFHI